MRKVSWPLGLGLIVLGIAYVFMLRGVPAAAQAAPAAAAPPGNNSADVGNGINIENSPVNGKFYYDDGRQVTRMTGDVRVTQEGKDFVLYCDEITYNGLTNQADATGNLRIETPDTTIVGAKMHANFDTRIITTKGSVVMKSRGAGDGMNKKKGASKGSLRAQVTDKSSQMTCDQIDFNYATREAIVGGNIKMTQADKRGTCNSILFLEKKNVARLTGNVVFVNGKNQTFRAPEIIVWIDENRMKADRVEAHDPQQRTKPEPPARETDLGPAPTDPDFGDAIGPAPNTAPAAPAANDGAK